jgi:hypothetical protein
MYAKPEPELQEEELAQAKASANPDHSRQASVHPTKILDFYFESIL